MVDSRDQPCDSADRTAKKQAIVEYVTDEHPRKITALEVSGAIDLSFQESQTLLEQLARSADIESRPSTGRYATRYLAGVGSQRSR